MPKLQCKVNQCAHNADGLCAKNYIDVDGPESHNKKETSCKSYLLKDVDTYNYEFAEMVTIHLYKQKFIAMQLTVYMKKDKDVMLIVLKLLMLIQNKVRINNLENQKPLIVKHLNQETN